MKSTKEPSEKSSERNKHPRKQVARNRALEGPSAKE
jgi:hypothetical protein